MDKLEHLKRSRLCRGLDDAELHKMAEIVSLRNLNKGEILFFEGDSADGFYLLFAGQVKIYKASADGKEQILHQIMPGQIFAEVAIFHGGQFPANCTAVKDSTVGFFPREEFLKLLGESPQISLKIIGSLSAFLREFTELVENLSLKEVPARIAGYLLKLSEESGNSTVILELTKSELAKQLGTLSETLSRGLRKLIDIGAISVDGKKITILAPDRLSDIALGEKI